MRDVVRSTAVIRTDSFKLPGSPSRRLHSVPLLPGEGAVPLAKLKEILVRDILAKTGWR
jgi:hypothetical protein